MSADSAARRRPPAASCSSTSRRAGPATTPSRARDGWPARARSATPERSTRWRPGCSILGSRARPGCSPTSSASTRNTTPPSGSALRPRHGRRRRRARLEARQPAPLPRSADDAIAAGDRDAHRRHRAGAELGERDQGRRQARIRTACVRARMSCSPTRPVTVSRVRAARRRRARRRDSLDLEVRVVCSSRHLHPGARPRPRRGARRRRAPHRAPAHPRRSVRRGGCAHHRGARRRAALIPPADAAIALFERLDLTDQQAIDLGHGKRIHVARPRRGRGARRGDRADRATSSG